VDPRENPRCAVHAAAFYDQVKRRGYTPAEAREYVRHDATVLAATMVRTGDADAMICGIVGRYLRHLKHVEEVIGLDRGVTRLTSMNAVVLHAGALFIADTYVQEDPDAQALAERLVTHLHLDPAKRVPRIFLQFMTEVTPGRLRWLALGAMAYALMRFAEAYGLWRGRRWAEWLGVVTAAVYIPFEAGALIRQPGAEPADAHRHPQRRPDALGQGSPVVLRQGQQQAHRPHQHPGQHHQQQHPGPDLGCNGLEEVDHGSAGPPHGVSARPIHQISTTSNCS